MNEFGEESLVYLAGYLAWKLKRKCGVEYGDIHKNVEHICKLYPAIDEKIIKEFIHVRLRIRVKYLNEIRKVKSQKNLNKAKQFIQSYSNFPNKS